MKKILWTLLFVLVLSTVLPVLAGEPTESAIPEVGTEIAGFVVTAIDHMEANDSDVVVLEHSKTGARLYWIANDNIDRSFTMGFRTPVYDETGMPHITEHITLEGSEKYPGSNVFFEMTNKTSNTFLNAGTYQSMTAYPMGSTSEEQLLIYMDYYLSGIFHPSFMTDKHAFMQDGYRYLLEDADAEITLTGTVYNEMQGSISLDTQARTNQLNAIFPGSYKVTQSGGNPDFIPTLQLEDLRAFHETYYHPSNSTSVLTGDINLERILTFLDSEYLSSFEKAEVQIEDSLYTPIEAGAYEYRFEYPASADASAKDASAIYYSFPIEVEDMVELNQASFLAAYLSNDSSPLMRLMNERLPELSFSAALEYDLPQPVISFTANYANEEDAAEFKAVIDEALTQMLQEGINEEVLNAFVNIMQYNTILSRDSSQIDLNQAQTLLYVWSIDGNRDNWKAFDEFESNLRDYISADQLNELAKKYFTAPETSVLSITVPVPGQAEEKEAALTQSLADRKAAMSEEEIATLVADTKEFHEWQEASESIHMSEEMNALHVDTLPEEVASAEASEATVNGIRFIVSEVETPLISVNLYLDSSIVPFEDLLDYTHFVSLIGSLDTDIYTREELSSKVGLVSNGIYINTSVFESQGDRSLKNYLQVSWNTLGETLEDSFALVEDILYHTDYSDYDYIRSQAAQNLAMYPMLAGSMGYLYGFEYGSAPFSPTAALSVYTTNTEYMNYLRKLSEMSDEEMDALTQKYAEINALLLNRNNAVVTIYGNGENLLKTELLAYDMLGRMSDTQLERYDYTKYLQETPRRVGIAVNDTVAYNFVGADLEAAGYPSYDAKLTITQTIVSDKIIMPELRYKKGAYGGGAVLLRDPYVAGLYSYRDPELRNTFEVYKSIGETLRTLEITEEELDQYIINTVTGIQAPKGKMSLADQAIEDKLTGKDTPATQLQQIRDAKAMTLADIADYADLFDAMSSEAGSLVTVGPQSMIEANADLYDEIIYDFLGSEEDEAAFEEEAAL